MQRNTLARKLSEALAIAEVRSQLVVAIVVDTLAEAIDKLAKRLRRAPSSSWQIRAPTWSWPPRESRLSQTRCQLLPQSPTSPRFGLRPLP